MLRWDDRRTPDEARELSTRIWSVRISLSRAPRRISFDDAADLSVEPEDLVSEDYTVCQDLADEARARGEAALIVPSAALPGTETLVLFGPKLLAPWQLTAPDIAIDVPAAVTADRSGPPLAALPHVRWRGAQHEGLRRWKNGLDGPFYEPVPTPT